VGVEASWRTRLNRLLRPLLERIVFMAMNGSA
jgi:hypothetical protein